MVLGRAEFSWPAFAHGSVFRLSADGLSALFDSRHSGPLSPWEISCALNKTIAPLGGEPVLFFPYEFAQKPTRFKQLLEFTEPGLRLSR